MNRKTRLPKYRRDGEAFGPIQLTDRDREILDLVYRYRYVRAEHVFALIPGSDRQIARRLQALFHHEYVRRFVPPSRMQDSFAGSPKMVYALDSRGASEIAETLYEVPVSELSWRKDHGHPGRHMEWFAEHHTEVSDFHATLELAVKGRRGLSLAVWQQGSKAKGKCTWENLPGRTTRTFRVSPDGYFAVEDGGVRRNFFLEIDRGTERRKRIHKKLEEYAWYLQHDDYRERYDRATDVRVLVVTKNEYFRDRHISTLRELRVTKMQPGWFWFTTASEFTLQKPARLLGPIWRTVTRSDTSRPLFK